MQALNTLNGFLKVDFINVGFGDCTYIELNNNGEIFNMLIDGGRPGYSHYKNNPQRIRPVDYLKKNNIFKIDLLVLTHFHQDHAGGLKEVVDIIEVGRFWCNYLIPYKYRGTELKFSKGFSQGSKRLTDAINIYNYIFFKLLDKQINICCVNKDLIYESILDSLTIDVLWPDLKRCQELMALMEDIYNSEGSILLEKSLDELDKCLNDFCIVMKIKYKDVSILLSGDAVGDYWNNLNVDMDLTSQILKLPHHAQSDSFSDKLFELTNPQYVVISAANDWTYKCPQRNVVEKISMYPSMKRDNCKIFFTDAVDMEPFSTKDDMHNAVRFIITGEGVKVSNVYLTL